MYRVHVCTTENISMVLKMRLTKMEMQKRTHKKTNSNNNKAEHTATKRRKKKRTESHTFRSHRFMCLAKIICCWFYVFTLFFTVTLCPCLKSLFHGRVHEKFIEIQGDTKTVHRNGTLIIMSLSVSEFSVYAFYSVIWSECVCILYYLMNIE